MKLLLIVNLIAASLQISGINAAENTPIIPENMHDQWWGSHEKECDHNRAYLSTLNSGVKPSVGRVFKISMANCKFNADGRLVWGFPSNVRVLVVNDILGNNIAWLLYDSHMHTFNEFLAEFEPYFDFSTLTRDNAQCFLDS